MVNGKQRRVNPVTWAKFQNVKKLLPSTTITYDAGWDLKALWELRDAKLPKTVLADVLRKNGWIKYYKAIVG